MTILRLADPDFWKIGAAVLASLALGAGAMERTVDIAGLELGLPPARFEFARTGRGPVGAWSVVPDENAVGGRAIGQTSADPTADRFPLAIVPGVSAKDLEVTVRLKPVAGSVDQAGGIAVRLASANNYYVVRANALEGNVRFYRVVKGKREQLAGADVKVASGAWQMLGLKAEGDRFTVLFDGAELFTVRDGTFADAGRIALWTKADSITRFDAIAIRTLP
jgi:hypothetical protein